jgi:hypothetical protein
LYHIKYEADFISFLRSIKERTVEVV